MQTQQVVLFARVATNEQEKFGHSLPAKDGAMKKIPNAYVRTFLPAI